MIFAFTVPLSFILTKIITGKTRPLFRLRSRKLGELNGFVEEMISGQKTLKAYHQEKNTIEQFDARNEEAVETYYRAEYYGSVVGPTVNFINNLSLSMVSVFGALLYLAGQMTIGNISSFILYSRKFSGPINEAANILSELQSALAAAERVFGMIDELPEKPDVPEAVVLESTEGNVVLKDVTFGYYKDNPIIKNLNLQAHKGELIAIVGPTGCGKTTFINLLMRFYDPDGGQILLDGVNTRQMDRRELRHCVGMVLQDTWLKAGTIRENIAMGKPDATEEEILAAARQAHADGFIRRLPQGYDTVIGESGGSLSQGQKQLLCIARVMLCLPPMLFLDEATSSIDTRTEAKIQQAFNTMMEGRTSFIVAHRLSTVREADLILVMRDGHIVEQGSHEALLQQDGFYAQLYRSQFAH